VWLVNGSRENWSTCLSLHSIYIFWKFNNACASLLATRVYMLEYRSAECDRNMSN
jgi:hypothetical protein